VFIVVVYVAQNVSAYVENRRAARKQLS
jgi:hypothetical protein